MGTKLVSFNDMTYWLHSFYITDVSETSSHATAFAKVKSIVGTNGLNVLFNNAGSGGRSVRISAVKEDDIMNTFRVNTLGPVMLSKVNKILVDCLKS